MNATVAPPSATPALRRPLLRPRRRGQRGTAYVALVLLFLVPMIAAMLLLDGRAPKRPDAGFELGWALRLSGHLDTLRRDLLSLAPAQWPDQAGPAPRAATGPALGTRVSTHLDDQPRIDDQLRIEPLPDPVREAIDRARLSLDSLYGDLLALRAGVAVGSEARRLAEAACSRYTAVAAALWQTAATGLARTVDASTPRLALEATAAVRNDVERAWADGRQACIEIAGRDFWR